MGYLTRTSPRRLTVREQPYRANPAASIECGSFAARQKRGAVSLPRRNAKVALDESGAPDFNEGANLRPQPLSDRRARFQILLADHGPGDAARFRFVEHSETGGVAVSKSACWLALEGSVSNRLDAPYRSGLLDQSQVQGRPRGRRRRLDDHPTANSALSWLASIAASISSMSAASLALRSGGSRF